MGSVVKKRRKKITKHKYRKQKKKSRHKNKQFQFYIYSGKKEGSSQKESAFSSFLRKIKKPFPNCFQERLCIFSLLAVVVPAAPGFSSQFICTDLVLEQGR